MFRHVARKRTLLGTALRTLELIFHCAVRDLRKSHGNALLGLLMAIFQSILIVIVLYVTFDILGLRSVAVRGDFVLYVMSGAFMFTTHISAIGAVSRADGPASPMMLHSPMNPIIAICGAALAVLYKQVLAALVVLFLYHALFTPVVIEDPVSDIGILLLAWASGIGIGMVLRSARPWQPDLASVLTTVIMRVNIFASGKMMVANNVSPQLRSYFDWNPLFHIIDQARGYTFLNYTPHFTSVGYALKVTLVFITIGLMAEFFTKLHVSESWGKRH